MMALASSTLYFTPALALGAHSLFLGDPTPALRWHAQITRFICRCQDATVSPKIPG
jgi:hypothetical protein